MMKLMHHTLVLMLLLCTETLHGGLLINEVMSNEPGSDRLLEWVELWNYSDSLLHLAGFSFVDEDRMAVFGDTTELKPYEYLVIARSLERYEAYWGDGSGTWGDSELEGYRLITCGISLRNGSDTVMVVDEFGNIVSFCRWTSPSPDGISRERCDPRCDDASATWEDCRSPDGSTPGARNSVTPGNNDLKLNAEFKIIGDYRNQLVARMTVHNVGISSSDSNELRFGVDPDGDMILDQSDIIFRQLLPPLATYDSVTVQTTEEFSPELHVVLVSLLADDDPTNNDTLATLRFGLQPFEIVINEILPDPAPPFETEWIELYNVADRVIDLDNWSLCDCIGCARFDSLSVNGGDYLVLCQDVEAFRAFYDATGIVVAAVSGWRSLNNTGDIVYLVDQFGLTVDSMLYESGIGDNVSLERIDPRKAGYDASNWYRSTAPEGSTPGSANSVRRGFADELRVELDSRVISPDGDGIDDFLTIRYDIPRDSELSLRIFDLNGRIVRTIFENECVPSGEYRYFGSTDDGRMLEIGMYILLAEFSGETEMTRKLVFAVVGRK